MTRELPQIPLALRDRMTAGLDRVETLIRERIEHDDPFIASASGHLVSAGGKRFRPMLTLLTAQLGGGFTDETVIAAAAVELTHLASLYHDDVMDAATMRRGAEAVNTAYGNSTAILVGDLLFGHASALVAELGAEAVRIQAETFIRLCTGQIRDDRQSSGAGESSAEFYVRVLQDKTGALIATAARFGAMYAGCDAATVRTVAAYGERLGVAFQLADDVIDVRSDAAALGKEPGTDLREGKRTLATLKVLEADDPADARLRELVSRPLPDPDERAEALALLRGHRALQEAREETLAMGRAAQEALASLPESDAKDALVAVAESATIRLT